MRVVAAIFARGGSKGLPRKNLLPIGGQPMIAWAISHAKAVPCIDRVIVSTDSEEIARVARHHGAETPFLRPTELSNDDSPEWLAWRHAVRYLESDEGLPDVLVVIPVTSPLRKPEDIEKCIQVFKEGDSDVVLTARNADRNPHYNMIKLLDDGTVELVLPSFDRAIKRRQDAPEVFDLTTVAYVVSPKYVLEKDTLFEGRVRAVIIPKERAIDVDTELDFKVAQFLMSEYRGKD